MMGIGKTGEGIDFVLLWVNGEDPEWQEAFLQHAESGCGDRRRCRYREWDNLRYIFRGFECFAPWVRKIHFVTWGHLPFWLNINHPKLTVVRHEDFLDIKSLPVFSCNPLEVNLHRIPGLAERFVYFNDDTFLLKPIGEDYFFHRGLPRDMLVFNAIFMDTISHIRLNDIQIVNDHFRKRDVIRKNFAKVFNFTYGIQQARSLLLWPWPQITGFYDTHQPQPFLKQTFDQVWAVEPEVLGKTTCSRFRSRDDVNQYLFRYWQMLNGNFEPRSFADTGTIPVRDASDVEKAARIMADGKYTMFCINDELGDVPKETFREYKQTIINSLESMLPDLSAFELKSARSGEMEGM